MIQEINSIFDGRKVLIAGFGREGRSTLRYLEKYCRPAQIGISDRDDGSVRDEGGQYRLFTGKDYPGPFHEFDVITVSPGIPRSLVDTFSNSGARITSQSDLILSARAQNIIGITGTKGKSTTSTLLNFLFVSAGVESTLAGNIGIPPLDHAGELTGDGKMVLELSSSQLESITTAPHMAILLNLFPEHLDRYENVSAYYEAKSRIVRFQKPGDILIMPAGDEEIGQILPEIHQERKTYFISPDKKVDRGAFIRDNMMLFRDGEEESVICKNTDHLLLKGDHNLINILAASTAAILCDVPPDKICRALGSFPGLEHRLEYAGSFRGVTFFNDSIATIPESSIRAIESVEQVDTLLLGGFDRGLDYRKLYEFLPGSPVRNIIFFGPAGKRMSDEYRVFAVKTQNLVTVSRLEDTFPYIWKMTKPGGTCLLSPAAASYDEFRNFEERGTLFKKMAGSPTPPAT